MYYPYFISYITVGIVLSALVFWWALRNGQFKDQQRARFLPLEKEDGSVAVLKNTRLGKLEALALLLLACAGLAASAAVIIFALLKAH